MWLEGTEALTIELGGVLPERATDALAATVPDRLVLERDAARWGRFSILVIEMRRLGLDLPVPLPIPRADYREVLHRVAATYEGDPAWLAVRCDLDRAFVRGLAARIIRYPVAAARISIVEEPSRVTVDASAEGRRLAVTVDIDESRTPPLERPRRTFVMDGESFYEIPWQERPTPQRYRARVEASDVTACAAVLGAEVHLDGLGTVHRGRVHRCGRARAVSGRLI